MRKYTMKSDNIEGVFKTARGKYTVKVFKGNTVKSVALCDTLEEAEEMFNQLKK